MKTKIMIVAFATLLLGITSCNKKDRNDNQPAPTSVSASKTSKIKKGEPISFSFSQAPAGSNVLWTVAPASDVQINPSGNSASVLFNNAGSYTVNASYGSLNGSVQIGVIDSIYNPGGGGTPTYQPLTGDQIFITVSKMDSMGITGLGFRFITANKYNCLNHSLLFDNNFSGQDLQVVFNWVYIPSEESCTAGEDYASSGTSWFPVAEGTHGFEVVLDGNTYTGSFVKSGSTFTFTWPYTSGVTVTPLILY
ncbi:MAG: hypothetical protein NTU98_14510 [Bacteroidetes bacterium]|nr:hypothetical protein [Bacteroidota bacterium]